MELARKLKTMNQIRKSRINCVNQLLWKARNANEPELEKMLKDLRQNISYLNSNNFDKSLDEIYKIIDRLPKGKRFILKYSMCYKFSKSSPEYTNYFYERHYIDYPEFACVHTSNEMGLSFVTEKEKLLDYMFYGDQLTLIPFDPKHPQYHNMLKDSLDYTYEYSGCALPSLLTGLNISLSNPYVIKNIIELHKCSDACIMFSKYYMEKYSPVNFLEVYERIGFYESAHFIRDIMRMIEIKGAIYTKIHLDEILPQRNNIIIQYEQLYAKMVKDIQIICV